MKRIVLTVLGSVWIIPATLCTAQTAPLGWPEVIALLTQERMQAEICVGMIKSSKNAGAIAAVKATYETTRPRVDGAIAGLTAALVEGGKPEALPSVRDDLEASDKKNSLLFQRAHSFTSVPMLTEIPRYEALHGDF